MLTSHKHLLGFCFLDDLELPRWSSCKMWRFWCRNLENWWALTFRIWLVFHCLQFFEKILNFLGVIVIMGFWGSWYLVPISCTIFEGNYGWAYMPKPNNSLLIVILHLLVSFFNLLINMPYENYDKYEIFYDNVWSIDGHMFKDHLIRCYTSCICNLALLF